MLVVDIVIVSTILLVAALVVTGVYSFILRVPFVPTPRVVAQAMVHCARLKGDERVYDLGAGDGTILINAKRMHPGISAVGVELVPTVWMLGRFKIWCSGKAVRFLRKNAMDVDLGDANAIFLYLLPTMLARLERKFDAELRPGTTVISHAFKFPSRSPEEVVKIPGGIMQRTLYRYTW